MRSDRPLTDNFYLDEFFGGPGQISEPTQAQELAAQQLCVGLERLRAISGGWVKITDGSRASATYGSKTSQHLFRVFRLPDGRLNADAAADINLENNSWDARLAVVRWYWANSQELPFSQLIWYPGTTHLHIGLRVPRLPRYGRLQFKMPDGGYPDVTVAQLIDLDNKYRKA